MSPYRFASMQLCGCRVFTLATLAVLLPGRAASVSAKQPLPPGVPPLAAGDLIQRVGAKLAVNHRSLGNVSAELMAVQSEVDNTERSLLGKLLDIQSARELYSQHEQISAANARASADIKRLTSQVQQLNEQLGNAQRNYVLESQAEAGNEHTLQVEAVKDEAIIHGLKNEQDRDGDVNKDHDSLAREHDELLKQSVHAVTEGELLLRQLTELRTQGHAEGARHELLRKSLKQMHTYCEQCHGRAEELAKDLVTAEVLEPKESAAATVAAKQAAATSGAGAQRLLAESALLRAEIRRADSGGQDALSALTLAQTDLQELEATIMKQVRDIKDNLGLEKATLKKVQSEVSASGGADDKDVTHKQAVEMQLSQLQEQLSPVIFAELNAENDALAIELNHATAVLGESKAAEARAFAAEQSADSEEEAQKQGVQIAADAVELARQQGQKDLEKAIADAAEAAIRQQAQTDQAASAIAAKCRAEWETYAGTKDEQIAHCKQLEEELSVVHAQQETLASTLQAQQTASAAVGF